MTAHGCFEYEGLTLRVKTNDSGAAAWLKEFLTPSFKTVKASNVDCTVELTVDQRSYNRLLNSGLQNGSRVVDAFVLDTTIVRLPMWRNGANGSVIFDQRFQVFYLVDRDRSRVRILTSPSNLDSRFALMRVVREFAMSWKARNRLLLHAAAFTVGDHGVIIAGPKRAGKTSLLIHCLRDPRARFVSNDRVLVKTHRADLMLRGIPTVVTVRADAWVFFPKFGRRLMKSRYDHCLALAEKTLDLKRISRAPDASFDLSPAQFCGLLSVPMQDRGAVHTVLFPRLTGKRGGMHLRRLSKPAAIKRLQSAIFAANSPRRTSEVFRIGSPGRNTDDRLYRTLADRVQFFECRMGEQAYLETTTVTELVAANLNGNHRSNHG